MAVERDCEHCGARFLAKRDSQRFCSVRHAQEAANRRRMAGEIIDLVCRVCGTAITTHRPDQKYCSVACRRRAEKLRRLEQQDQLFEEPREFRVLRVTAAEDGYRIIIVNDLQIPFQDQKTLEAVCKFWDDWKPHLEIFNGDIIDFYDISQFDKNPTRRFNLQDELDTARRWLETRVSANTGARRIWDDGNHEDRLRRWLWRYGPEMASLRALTVPALLGLEEMGFEHLPYRSVIDFLSFRVEHGYRTHVSAAFPVNVARLMAIATGSSGLCGHTHRFAVYSWSDSRGSHSYVENGCLCLTTLEYAPFPNWQHAFSYGVCHKNKLHLIPVQIYPSGFRAEGEFYPRV